MRPEPPDRRKAGAPRQILLFPAMKTLLSLILAAICAVAFPGCMSMPVDADLFSRSFKAEELTFVGATPWGNQQVTAKNVEFFTDAAGLGKAAGQASYVFQEVNPDGTPIAPAPAADPEPVAPPASTPAVP